MGLTKRRLLITNQCESDLVNGPLKVKLESVGGGTRQPQFSSAGCLYFRDEITVNCLQTSKLRITLQQKKFLQDTQRCLRQPCVGICVIRGQSACNQRTQKKHFEAFETLHDTADDGRGKQLHKNLKYLRRHVFCFVCWRTTPVPNTCSRLKANQRMLSIKRLGEKRASVIALW